MTWTHDEHSVARDTDVSNVANTTDISHDFGCRDIGRHDVGIWRVTSNAALDQLRPALLHGTFEHATKLLSVFGAIRGHAHAL